jgi:hypothetical protein
VTGAVTECVALVAVTLEPADTKETAKATP